MNQIEDLLDLLEKERCKFSSSNKEKIQAIVNDLVLRGVYPNTTVMKRHNYTPMNMVEAWGARWHEWKEPLNCPCCGADWRDSQSGPPFKREIGIYSDEQDGTVAWKCPDCQQSIPRLS